MKLLSIALLALTLVLDTEAQDAAKVLVDSSNSNGGFETGQLAPWKAADRLQKTEIRVAAGNLPAAEGSQFIALRSVGDAAVFLTIKNPDPGAGRLFRITWKARSRAAEEFNKTTASIEFQTADGMQGKTNAKENKKISADKWDTYSFEAVCKGDAPIKSVKVAVGLGRRSLSKTPVESEGYLDDIKVEQLSAPALATISAPVVAPAVAGAAQGGGRAGIFACADSHSL